MATEDSGTGLPASIEAAWGLRERAGKGPRPGLTLGRIVDAAVGIASADGLGAVSMSRVASELGVSTMSLYRYVSAKDELLTLMEDAAYGPPPPGEPAKDWRTGFTDWAWALRTSVARHPWVVNVPISTPPSTPNSVAWMERGLACLRRTNLSEGEKISVLMLVSGFVRNEARMTFDILAAHRRKGQSLESSMASWAKLLEKLTDAERFPAVTAALRTGDLDIPGGPDDEFVFGLERILDGVEALISARS
ncbi:TetR/AcrR family transcriptional regulator [Streptomyces iranensis]|uniref:AcrR family transcriptional regulator n=1 Tax=Streptomyces iranensis TaxID=576784 RepID=A0A060ZXU3_9ACTN|nr:TetR/AcrR family transcriptional regulator [Streptomyces iranensis]MBP2067965.1 AcrR family transcriptional regulator [Streptomyces iranensis]CDR07979.1 Tetracyclin repressor domain-containing protein [Streptomyces iranensis]